MRIIAAALTVTLALTVSACGTPVNRDSPTYSAGFGDGCATASAEDSGVPHEPQRNAALYRNDPGYRAGWIGGHAMCRRQEGPPRL